MIDKATATKVERRKQRRWNLPWWAYVVTLAGVFLILVGASSIVYN